MKQKQVCSCEREKHRVHSCVFYYCINSHANNCKPTFAPPCAQTMKRSVVAGVGVAGSEGGREINRRSTEDFQGNENIIYEEEPPKQNLFTKRCVFIHMFKLQSPSKYSPLDAIHLWRLFSHCSKQFFNSSIMMPFSASAVFFVPLLHIDKMFPFEDFYHSGGRGIVT